MRHASRVERRKLTVVKIMEATPNSRQITEVERFWDRRPCNIRHSAKEIGTRGYFDEVEKRKYFVEPHIPRFAEFERWRGKKVLEIGCGIGTDTANFARQGARVAAVDLSTRSLEIARQRARLLGLADRVEFYRANAEELTSSLPIEPYDLIYSFGVIHHTPRPEQAVQQMTSYVQPGTTIKIMVYHRYSWKVLGILLTRGQGRFWRHRELIAKYSEAQEGCPVTFTFTKREITRLLTRHGFEMKDLQVEHVFPYRVADYVQYRYVKEWYFRALPPAAFHWLERHFGWHLCVTAAAPQAIFLADANGSR
jgi:2-polyprenyl-3-methyl-5-hydroxy-6-metoxy-1,4-benzoquinol methylase